MKKLKKITIEKILESEENNINREDNFDQSLISFDKDSFSINLKPIGVFIKKKYKIALLAGFLMFFVGVFYAFLSPVEFSSSIRLVQENNQNSIANQSLFRNLNMLGVGGKSSSGDLSSETYPDIVKSTPFVLELLNKRITFHSLDSNVVIEDYFSIIQKTPIINIIKKYTIRLPSRLISSFEKKPKNLPLTLSKSGNNSNIENRIDIDLPLTITRPQLRIINELSSRIELTVDEINYIDIVCTMPDPIASAELTQLVYYQLTKYIIEDKTRKDLINKNFIEERKNEVKVRFYTSQQKLADFKDQNRNIQTAGAKTEDKDCKQSTNWLLLFTVP